MVVALKQRILLGRVFTYAVCTSYTEIPMLIVSTKLSVNKQSSKTSSPEEEGACVGLGVVVDEDGTLATVDGPMATGGGMSSSVTGLPAFARRSVSVRVWDGESFEVKSVSDC